jgi:putative endonuclease
MAVRKKLTTAKPWYLYLIECNDGSLYTGITVDVAERFAVHIAGKGGRYTRSHPPRKLAAVIGFADRSEATKAEIQVKKLSTEAKRELCRRHPPSD